MIPEYTVEKANLFNNPPSYEIEIELLPSAVSYGDEYTFQNARGIQDSVIWFTTNQFSYSIH